MVEGYADIADLQEDDRIKVMAATCIAGKVISCQTDDVPGKADRYIEKMEAAGARYIKTGPGLVRGTVSISFGPPLDS